MGNLLRRHGGFLPGSRWRLAVFGRSAPRGPWIGLAAAPSAVAPGLSVRSFHCLAAVDPTSNQIVAVTSFGRTSPNDCQGNDYSYRVDRQEVIDWIDEVSGNHWNQ